MTRLECLQGARYFSSIELRWGYWQIAVDDQDREKTSWLLMASINLKWCLFAYVTLLLLSSAWWTLFFEASSGTYALATWTTLSFVRLHLKTIPPLPPKMLHGEILYTMDIRGLLEKYPTLFFFFEHLMNMKQAQLHQRPWTFVRMCKFFPACR